MTLIDGDLKLVITPDKPDSDELYNLDSDRGEETDIVADHPDVAARMRVRLEAFEASARSSDEGEDY
jgi:hypothetical protein